MAAFWQLSDGMDANGRVLYGATQSEGSRGPGVFWQGIVDANAVWRDESGREARLVLDETDMDLLTVYPDGGASVLRDSVSGT